MTTRSHEALRWGLLDSMGSGSRYLLILLALTVVRGFLYGLLNPYLGSPDERDHLQYVAHIATAGASGPIGREGHQPPLYYALVAPAYWLGVGHSAETQALAVRLASLPLLLAEVVLIWVAGRKLVPHRPMVAAIAAGFVALHPENTLIAVSINNDNAANLMGAVFTCLAVWLVHDNRPSVLFLSTVAIGAGLLSKGQLLPAVLLFSLVMAGGALMQALHRRSMHLISFPLLAAGIAGLILLLQRETTQRGFTQLLRSTRALTIFDRGPEVLQAIQREAWKPFGYQLTSFWAAFMGESVQPGPAWYLLPSLVVVLGLLGYLAALPGRRPGSPGLNRRDVVLRVVFVVMVLAQGAVVYINYLHDYLLPSTTWKLQYMQGRYLFPALGPLALLVAEGWGILARTRSLTPDLAILLSLSGLVLFDVVALSSLLGVYCWPVR